jgi:dTDP-4-dehydrorhamnose 3,5-epimerase
VSRFIVRETSIPGVRVLDRHRARDDRGAFSRLFEHDALAGLGWSGGVHQVNHSRTTSAGTVRGLHYQEPPDAEDKLVTCLHGEIWDVTVDLRRESPTYLLYVHVVLSEVNGASVLIPRGCAHGFQALSDDVDLIYVHNAPYRPATERGLHPLDPLLGIVWPLPVSKMSPRDAGFAPIDRTSFVGVDVR